MDVLNASEFDQHSLSQKTEGLFNSNHPETSQTTNAEGRVTPFQRWYKFKEAFAPSLVLEQINDCPKPPKLIVDPFGGSGTTAMISSSLGISCSTIEVNPFLADLIEAKTTEYDPQSILLAFDEVLGCAALDKGKSLVELTGVLPKSFVEGDDKQRWIFNRDIASRIFALRTAIGQLKNRSEARLLKVLLGSCLIEVSNVVISGKGRRYRRNWKDRDVSPDYLDALFQLAVSNAVADISRFRFLCKSKPVILRGDARDRVNSFPSEIDLALFSPPYPNSFDYTDIYNVELWVLGYLNAPSDNRALREATLRSHVQIKREFGEAPSGSRALTRVLRQLDSARSSLWSPWIPEMVGAYFCDLNTIITSIGQKLSEDGRVVMVVGDSRYAGVQIPVAKILSEVAASSGLKTLSTHSARSMRSSPQQGGSRVLAESLITLTK